MSKKEKNFIDDESEGYYMTLVDENDFDLNLLEKYFDKEHFFIKLSPINKNEVSEANGMGDGVIEGINLV